MDPEMTSQQASEQAIDNAKSAQAAIELAREVQITEAVEKTAKRTKDDVLEVFREVFGSDGTKDPQMRVLVQRIPILCTQILQMHSDIGDIKDNQKWALRTGIGVLVTLMVALLLGAARMVFHF